MRKLINSADAYIKSMSITEMTQLKFCLCSIGVLIGLNVKKEHRKYVAVGAATLFTATYIPLMTRFIKDTARNYMK